MDLFDISRPISLNTGRQGYSSYILAVPVDFFNAKKKDRRDFYERCRKFAQIATRTISEYSMEDLQKGANILHFHLNGHVDIELVSYGDGIYEGYFCLDSHLKNSELGEAEMRIRISKERLQEIAEGFKSR